MAAKALNNIFYVAGDTSRAQRFYETALGLQTAFADPGKWVQMKLGGVKFAISSAEEAGPGASGATVVFEVDDMEETKAAVLKAGGKIVGERDMGSHGFLVMATDTEGNLIHLMMRQHPTVER